MTDLPIRSWNEDAIPRLLGYILELVQKDGIVAFCIRQTREYSALRAEHDCDEAVLLYESADGDTGVLVNDSLIKAFYDHPLCKNDILETLGEENRKDGKSVYLAIWYGCSCTPKR